MKHLRYILLFSIFQFLIFKSFSLNKDSLVFIEDVKKFAFKEMGVELKGDFYTKSLESDKPYIYVYASLSDKIKAPYDLNYFFFCDTNSTLGTKKAEEYAAKGYHAFCYKTYANSDAKLNKRFLSYPREAEAFIIFHELTHNYISQLDITIPYDFNEALSDLIGNYGALDYYSKFDLKNLKVQQKQLENNYSVIILVQFHQIN